MNPQIAAPIFLPVVEVLRRHEIPLDRWEEADEAGEKQPLESNAWIDELTFRSLLAAAINAGKRDELVGAAEKLLQDESLGLGGLLFPFAASPWDMLAPTMEVINTLSRTLRVTLTRTGKRTGELTLATTMRQPAPPVLCTWLDAVLAALRRYEPRLTFEKTACMFAESMLVETGGTCCYEIQWKRRWGMARTAKTKRRLITDGVGRARRVVTQLRLSRESLDIRLKAQEALLHGIVSLSTATKSVRTYQDLIHLTATRICSDFGFDRSLVYLARGQQLEIVSVIDPQDMAWAQSVYATCQKTPIPLDDRTEESKAFASGRPVVVNNAWNNIFVPQTQQAAWKSRSYLIMPIRGADRIIGLMLADQYYKRNNIESDDVDKLQAVANISGMAIEKLRLIDRLEAKVSSRTTELEKANKKLTQLYERARESDRLKSDFLANMSHELRTPLNSVIGFSKIMLRGLDGPLTEKQTTDLGAILNSGTHLLGLINDILDLSKIESGRMELTVEEFDLNAVVGEAITSGEALLKQKPVELLTRLDPELRMVWGDRLRVRQVLLNLLSNAIKFTDEGSVTISTKAGNNEFLIAVTDTGTGIPADKIEQAFDRFRQLDSSPSRLKGGSGLGLTISKKFVEMHGGRIWVTSTEGVGSTFHVALPMKQPNDNKQTGKQDD